jgi:2,3-bisphosphoglycerate-dependent phosphoglycerate mutase
MKRIGLIRHGVTDWNNERRAQGQTDVPLNKDGHEQAEKLAERLNGETWDLVVTSPLSRAFDTANAVAKKLEIPLITDDRLKEMSFGEVEGTTERERVAKWGSSWKQLDLGGEPDEVVRERSLECVEEFSEIHQNKNILFVSHGATLRQLVMGLLKEPSFNKGFGNTSLSLFEKRENKWTCSLLNCSQHIQDPIQKV